MTRHIVLLGDSIFDNASFFTESSGNPSQTLPFGAWSDFAEPQALRFAAERVVSAGLRLAGERVALVAGDLADRLDNAGWFGRICATQGLRFRNARKHCRMVELDSNGITRVIEPTTYRFTADGQQA